MPVSSIFMLAETRRIAIISCVIMYDFQCMITFIVGMSETGIEGVAPDYNNAGATWWQTPTFDVLEAISEAIVSQVCEYSLKKSE